MGLDGGRQASSYCVWIMAFFRASAERCLVSILPYSRMELGLFVTPYDVVAILFLYS